MFKYIKWELKNYFNRKYIWFIFIAIIYLLIAFIPVNNLGFLNGLIILSFSAIVFASIFGSFLFGTKKVLDTFSKKTFLLESMIPYPPKKILLSKYLLGIIINFMFSLIGLIGLSIVIIRGGGFDALMRFLKFFIKEFSFTSYLRFSITYILSTITFMSFAVFGYILGKVLKPSGKGSRAIGAIIWILLLYTCGWIMDGINIPINSVELVSDMTYVVCSVVLFFASSWFIENKLEIYN